MSEHEPVPEARASLFPDRYLPEGVDPHGVPRPDAGRRAFVLLLAIAIAVLGLIVTLGWVVYHHLVVSA